MSRLVIEGLRLKSLNELLRMNRWKRHAYVKHVRKEVELASIIFGCSAVLPAEKKVKVTITVHHPGSYDRDGLHGAIKPVLDSIVARPASLWVGKTKLKLPAGIPVPRRWGLVLDDSEKHVDLKVKQVKSEEYSVVIEVGRSRAGEDHLKREGAGSI